MGYYPYNTKAPNVTNRGLLLPRLTTTQRDALGSSHTSTPHPGTLIFNIDNDDVEVYTDALGWTPAIPGGDITVTGTDGAVLNVEDGGTLRAVAYSGSASDLTTGTLPTARLSEVPNSALENSSVTISGHSVPLGGSVNLGANDISGVPAAANTLATVNVLDDTAAFAVVEEGLANAAYQIAGADLFTRGRNFWAYNDNGGVPQLVDAAKSYDIHCAETGTVWLDVSTIAFNEPYFFMVIGGETVLYLDPGRGAGFVGWGNDGQPLKLIYGESVIIRRFSRFIFAVSGPSSASVKAAGSLPDVSITSGPTYTAPTGGGGTQYTNISGGSVTVDVSGIDVGAVYTFTSNSTSTTLLDPGAGGSFTTLGATITVPPSYTVSIVRWSAGIFYVLSFGSTAALSGGRLTRVDIASGPTYTAPTGGGGTQYTNISGGSVTVDVSGIDFNAIYTFTSNSTSTTLLDPGAGGSFTTLGTPLTVPAGCTASIVRWSTGIFYVVSFNYQNAITPSTFLDTIGSTSGGLLYRGSSGWAQSGALTANAFLTGGGAGSAPNAVAITGLVVGNGASAPTAFAGVSAQSNKFLTALSASGSGTLAQPASTNLSDYTAPTSWTPALSFGGTSTGITYSTQTGKYVQIGKLVIASFEIVLTSVGSATGAANISLPVNTTSPPTAASFAYYSNMTGINMLMGYANGSGISLYNSGSTSVANLSNTAFTNTTNIYGSVAYISS